MTRARTTQRLRVVLAATVVGWMLLLLVSPSWAPVDRDGPVGGAAVAAAIVHRIGAQVCHQRPDRSFHLHGRQLAVCGRCTGLYASGAIGVLAASLRRRRRGEPGRLDVVAPFDPPTPPRREGHRVTFDPRAGWFALAAVPTLITWAIEVAGLWNPGTPLRAVAAVPLGATAGWLMARALDS